MRLIDADELIKDRVDNDPVRIAAMCIPTAFYMDNVVKQLEEKAEIAYKMYMDCASYDSLSTMYQTQYQERKACLDIVKSGFPH